MRKLLALLLFAFASMALGAGLEGKKAPALALKNAQGVKQTLAEIGQGRPLVVLFWASWCPYCKALMPRLQAVVDELGAERVGVVAINAWEEKGADPAGVLRAGGFRFDLLLRGADAAKAWKVKGTPGLFVVDGAGIVIYDRNARLLKQEPPSPSAAFDPRTGAESSAERWVVDVREVLLSQLKKRSESAQTAVSAAAGAR